MKQKVRASFGLVAAIVVALAMRGRGCAQDVALPTADVATPQAATEDGLVQVLVLHDGGILAGKISRSGERYIVQRETGETYVPAGNVLLVASSLEDAYHQRRQRMISPTADRHLELADWCLRHQMLAFAHGELTEARRLDARSSKLVMLERRLALAMARLEAPPSPKKSLSTEATDTATAEIISPAVKVDVSGLPAGALERFTRKVQPVLVNSCTTTGCHQAGSATAFQLDRAIRYDVSNRRSTMSNLAAALTLVDRQNPQQSPLLTVPRQTHGGMEKPVFGPRQEAAYRHLYDWVMLVTANTAKAAPQSPSAPGITNGKPSDFVATNEHESTPQNLPVTRGERRCDFDVAPAAYEEEVPAAAPGDVALPENGASMSTLRPPQQLRYGATLERWTPRDEFDPAIFNRQQARAAEPTKSR